VGLTVQPLLWDAMGKHPTIYGSRPHRYSAMPRLPSQNRVTIQEYWFQLKSKHTHAWILRLMAAIPPLAYPSSLRENIGIGTHLDNHSVGIYVRRVTRHPRRPPALIKHRNTIPLFHPYYVPPWHCLNAFHF
jgi:hypothetical protein